MANNVHAPSLSPPFENGSISNSSTSFSTLYKDSAVVAGFNSGHLSFANINSSDKLSPLLPRPSPPPPPPPSLPPSPFLAVPFAKRPRGRPSGSKKKPEPTMEFPVPSTFISGERGDFLKPIVLIVPAGMDIVNAIINFGRDRDVSISVHHASGTISEVKLSNPLSPSDDLSLRENLHMVSFSGFYTNSFSSSPPKNIPYSFFTIQLSRGKPPQLFGGLAGGKLIAAEPVKVMASIIKKHEYHKVVHPITNPNVQPVMKSTRANHCAAIASNALSGITNTTNHLGFSVGASTSSSMNVQPLTTPFAPTGVNIHYWNNPTNQGDNY